MKNILGAVATCTNGKKDVNAPVFDRSDVRTDGIIARTVDIPAAVAMQINERFQSPDSCVSRLLKLSKEMFRKTAKEMTDMVFLHKKETPARPGSVSRRGVRKTTF